MKCPVCGHWNKDTFPRCFRCGEPLHAQDTQKPGWQDQFERPQQGKKRVVYDDTTPPVENLEAPLDDKEKETLAAEMTRLKDRRARGTVYLQDMRRKAAEEGMAPSSAGVTMQRGGSFFAGTPDDPSRTLHAAQDDYDLPPLEAPTEDASPAKARRTRDRTAPFAAQENPYAAYDIDMPPAPDAPGSIAPYRPKRRRRRVRGPMLIAYALVALLALSVVAFLVYVGASYIIPSLTTPRGEVQKAESVRIEQMEMDGLPGHRIMIAGEEGTQIYIAELMKSYVVVNGVATIDAQDHVFYDTIANLEDATMEVMLTPTLLKSGTETRLEPIRYTIDIPASPLRIIQPEGGFINVNASVYSIQIEVAPSSTVIVAGENISDTIDAKGVVYKNYAVKPIGENVVSITVRAPYCRESNEEIVIYREPIDIPLELDAATMVRTSEAIFTLHATTDPDATITVESPYESIDDSVLAETGAFSVKAKMTRVGNNRIVLRASMPGKNDAVVEHTVYYLPPDATYTPKAWALTRQDYNELLNNINMRIENAQIYLCKGKIIRFISENPQIAVMDTSQDGKEQLVVLENASSRQWELDATYRVYADVSGVYNNMPRLIGRYTHNP